MNNQQDLRPGEEEALEGLLREMAPVAEAPAEVRERIRAVVAAEWRAAHAAPPASVARARAARRWQVPAFALAAGLAVAVLTLGLLRQAPVPPVVVATLARVSGPVEAGQLAAWQPAAAGQALAVGQELVTGPRGKAALALGKGVTVRLDANTRVALAGIDRMVVERGAVYLDAGEVAGTGAGQSLRIDSRFGSTRHLGTQYEVRVLPEALQVTVREGRVETAPAAGRATVEVAAAGEQLVVAADGNVARQAVDRRDPRWNWIADVTPPYAIEDRKLADFLAWVCRETGRELTYADPQTEAVARAIVLRGSVAGMAPDEALAAVMATTQLTYLDNDGRLVVQQAERRAATR
jgi:ferric-dicitrate binding protein FerR (iron transport regulator)